MPCDCGDPIDCYACWLARRPDENDEAEEPELAEVEDLPY